MILLENSTTQKYDEGSYQGNWGDQGNGTYCNPILAGDFSDPDIIRVDNEYYLISSTMQLSPGLTVLHSNDLVNWEIISHAVPDLTSINSRYNWDVMDGYSRGIWAPCITYNPKNKMFFIHFCTPDEGFFMVHTSNPFNGWSKIYSLKKVDGTDFGAGWDDCTVLWDDDGKGYFLATNFSDTYKTYLFSLSEDGYTLLDQGCLIHQSHDSYNPMEFAPEANKLFKKDGIYYFFHNGCYHIDGRTVRMAWMMRSDCIYGRCADGKYGSLHAPGIYEHIEHPIVEGYREPCQGNFVSATTSQGEKWYFLTHHGQTDIEGRPCSLLPVKWRDGWPVILGNTSEGHMLWGPLPKPFPNSPQIRPQTSDDFNSPTLGLQWMWNFQPRNNMWSLTDNPGFLRLYAFRPIKVNQPEFAGNTILQRSYRNTKTQAIAKIVVTGMENGQISGLLHAAGSQMTGIGISQQNDHQNLTWFLGHEYQKITVLSNKIEYIWFKSEWNFDFQNQFSYSLDGINYINAGPITQLLGKDYRGDSIGFFNYNNEADKGYIDIAYIHIS